MARLVELGGLGSALLHPAFLLNSSNSPAPQLACDCSAVAVVGVGKLLLLGRSLYEFIHLSIGTVMVELLTKKVVGGRYTIKRRLGNGAFSDTYLARDEQIPDKPVCVVKCLKAPVTERFDWARARHFFNIEAQALCRLSRHTSRVPRLLAHFEENQQFYLVQEYIEGQDLSCELVLGRQQDEQKVLDLVLDILNILQVVHEQGVIHRDIKPHNLIRREDGKIVLIDFGAVKQLSTHVVQPDGQTTESILIGTPGYMAGEQRAGKPRYCSDIYSVGIIAIQALTGLNPKEIGEDADGELTWRELAHVSPRFATILTKMVRSHWRDRYQTIEEVVNELEKLKRNQQKGWSQGIPKGVSRSLKVAGVVAASLLMAGGVRYLWQSQGFFTFAPAVVSPFSEGDIVPLRTLDTQSGSVFALAMHPKGRVVVSGGQDEVIQLWDMQSGILLTSLTGHLQAITALQLTPEGETLVSGSADKTVKIWNLESGSLRYTLTGHEGRINSVHVSPDGSLAVSGSNDRTLKVWDLRTGREVRTLTGHTGAVNQVKVSADARFIISASSDGTIKVWDLPTGKLLQTMTGHENGVQVIAVSRDSQTLVSGGDDKIIVWNMTTGKKLQAFSQSSQSTRSLTFSRDGRYLMSAHQDGTIKLWNWRTGRLLETVRGHSDSVGEIVICPNNRTLVSGSLDHHLGVWQLRL